MSLSSAIHLARRLPPTETLGQRLGPSLKHEAKCGHCSGAGEGEATPKQPWLVIAASSIGTLAIPILTILVPDATMVCDPIAALLVEPGIISRISLAFSRSAVLMSSTKGSHFIRCHALTRLWLFSGQ